jgi:hypothetical protein
MAQAGIIVKGGASAAPRRAGGLAAVELALEAGVPTKTHVLNLLHRRTRSAQMSLSLNGAF